jgi:hypothetical protein
VLGTKGWLALPARLPFAFVMLAGWLVSSGSQQYQHC